MASVHGERSVPKSLEGLIRPILRDGLTTVTVDNDLLLLDIDANEVIRVRCVDASVDDIVAVLADRGLVIN
jgi:hypothetical protein